MQSFSVALSAHAPGLNDAQLVAFADQVQGAFRRFGFDGKTAVKTWPEEAMIAVGAQFDASTHEELMLGFSLFDARWTGFIVELRELMQGRASLQELTFA